MAGEGGETPQPTGEQPPNPAEAAQEKTPTSGLGTGPRIPAERFTIEVTRSPSDILAEAAKQVVNTPPEQLLKSSQWRRDSGQDATEASLNQGLPQSTVKETGVSTPNSTNQSPTK